MSQKSKPNLIVYMIGVFIGLVVGIAIGRVEKAEPDPLEVGSNLVICYPDNGVIRTKHFLVAGYQRPNPDQPASGWWISFSKDKAKLVFLEPVTH